MVSLLYLVILSKGFFVFVCYCIIRIKQGKILVVSRGYICYFMALIFYCNKCSEMLYYLH